MGTRLFAIAAFLASLTLCYSPSADGPEFQDIAAAAGLRDTFPNGGIVSKKFIIETTGSGIAFIDYDNDGLLDLFVVSGDGGTNRMYHNEGGDRFRDVTGLVGLRSEGWGQGVCAGDYDNDGFTDLFVTYWGTNRLYQNVGGKYFKDVTRLVQLQHTSPHYGTGCSFVDIDNDGRLDLFVANYLQFSPKTTPAPGANAYCYYRGIPVACGPRGLPFARNLLYRNRGDGTFEDISQPSGIAAPVGHYGLGVLAGHLTGHALPDIYVACDQSPSLLYVNQGGGKFEEEAVLRGVAFDANGKEMSGMGVDAGDFAGNGHPGIFRTNFSDEFETLYANRGDGTFDDVTLDSGLGHNTRYVGWGTGFFDFNNDGWKDLLLVNGHTFPEVDKLGIDVHYKDHAILYENDRFAKFRDISATAGPAFLARHSSRGAAFGDIDNDGRIEVAINNQGEPPSLLKQSRIYPAHWVGFQLTGTSSNRSAIGAQVRLLAGGHRQAGEVRSGGSYLSQNDLRLHFGLGSSAKVDRLQILWPDGRQQELLNLAGDRMISIIEP